MEEEDKNDDGSSGDYYYYYYYYYYYKMLSYRRETALQGALVLAKSGRLELGENILRTL